jgi:hypothetical protein
MKQTIGLSCLLLFFVWCGRGATAGILDDFEKDATKEKSPAPVSKGMPEPEESDECLDGCASEVFGACLEVFTDSCLEVFFPPRENVNTLSEPDGEPASGLIPREKGSSRMPIARADLSVANMNSGVTAWDGLFQFGYGGFGVQYRHTHLREDEPKDYLDLGQAHLLYRMTWAYADLSIGGGLFTIGGNESHAGASFTFPLSIHPVDRLALLWRPTLSAVDGNRIVDHDFGAQYTHRYFSLGAGYRVIRTENEKLYGPYAGAAFHW